MVHEQEHEVLFICVSCCAGLVCTNCTSLFGIICKSHWTQFFKKNEYVICNMTIGIMITILIRSTVYFLFVCFFCFACACFFSFDSTVWKVLHITGRQPLSNSCISFWWNVPLLVSGSLSGFHYWPN